MISTTIIAIANQKGGVGKTTTATNLAWAFAQQKYRTLLIDLDAQANATSSLGYEKTPEGSLYPVFLGQATLEQKLIQTRNPYLKLVPSEIELAALETELQGEKNYLQKLSTLLEPIRAKNVFDVILIDCPPALGMLSMNSLAASDYVLLTLQSEYLALEGLAQMLTTVEHLKEAGVQPNLLIGGIVMTMYDVRTRLSKQILTEVKSHFPELLLNTLIPRSVRLSEAPSFGKTIFEYDSLSSGAHAYEKLSKELAKRFTLTKGKPINLETCPA